MWSNPFPGDCRQLSCRGRVSRGGTTGCEARCALKPALFFFLFFSFLLYEATFHGCPVLPLLIIYVCVPAFDACAGLVVQRWTMSGRDLSRMVAFGDDRVAAVKSNGKCYIWNVRDTYCGQLYHEEVFAHHATRSTTSVGLSNTFSDQSNTRAGGGSVPTAGKVSSFGDHFDSVLFHQINSQPKNLRTLGEYVHYAYCAHAMRACVLATLRACQHVDSVLLFGILTDGFVTLFGLPYPSIPRNPCAVDVAPFCSSNYHADELPRYLFVADPMHVRVLEMKKNNNIPSGPDSLHNTTIPVRGALCGRSAAVCSHP